jgi:hypothetical protein
MPSGRPGGNPDLAKFQFQTNREESLDGLLQIRIAPSMKAELDALGKERNDFVREAIAAALARRKSSNS